MRTDEHPLQTVLGLLPPVQSQLRAAAALGISRSTLDRYVKTGLIPPPFRFGRLCAYPCAEIAALRTLDLTVAQEKLVARDLCRKQLAARAEMLTRCVGPLQAAAETNEEVVVSGTHGLIKSTTAFKEACRTAGAPPRWTEIPMTYVSAKARSGRSPGTSPSAARRGPSLRLSTAWILVANLCQLDWDTPGFIRQTVSRDPYP